MHYIKFALPLFAALFISVAATANENNPVTPEQILREKVVNLVGKPDVSDLDIHDRDATVEFLVTKSNELVVLGVETYSPNLEAHIKEQLNYKRVDVKGVKKMTTYKLDLMFIAD